jgi:5-methylcytosine-specific restriction endonuclease McrA
MSAGSTQQLVLVLNRLWQAINVCTAERALTLLYSGHAQVVCEDGGNFNTFSFSQWCDFSDQYDGEEVVHTISFRIRIPRVILLLFFDRLPNKEVKFTRHNVFERDKNTCQYCGHASDRKDLNLDHVIPRDRGGPTTWENIVCSCIECNTKKANRTPQEAGMHLIRKPKRPKWRPFVQINFSLYQHDSWKHFIDLAYWNVELGEDVA